MVIIFKLSGDTATLSSEKSNGVIIILNFIGVDLNSTFGEFTEFFVRKSAHISEYFILCLLIYRALKIDFQEKKLYLLSLLGTFCYALTDEIHQLFVPGRSGQIKDVFIDTSGGIMFLIIIIISIKMRKRLE